MCGPAIITRIPPVPGIAAWPAVHFASDPLGSKDYRQALHIAPGPPNLLHKANHQVFVSLTQSPGR